MLYLYFLSSARSHRIYQVLAESPYGKKKLINLIFRPDLDLNSLTLSFSDVPIYKLDKSSLGCGFPLWAIITLVVGATATLIFAVILNRKWAAIKFHFYAHFTNDDDSQDLSQMKYDAFVSYR